MLIHQHSSIPKYRVIRVLIQIIAVVIQISKQVQFHAVDNTNMFTIQ